MSDADVVMKTETPTETPPAPAAETPAEEKPAVAEEKEVKADGEGDVAEKEEKEEEKPVEKEEEKELEQDDLPDKRKSFMSAKNAVSTELNNHDALLNTCVSEGRIAQCMDQSFPFLYGATRATRGIKKGRYFFEVQVVSAGYKFSPEFRVGFSTKGSSLLGGAKTSIFFDSKGFVHKGEERTEGTRFTMEVVGVLLNLIKDSPNCNTISLFLNGKRSSKPIPLQDELKDVALFPHVLPKFCTIAANFQHPICPLPFKAKMLDDAPKDDVEDGVKASKECEIVVPFGANCLEWATEFAKKNPECILVTHDLVKTWVRESGGRVDRVPLIDDGGKTLCRVMNFRKRRYVYAFGSSLLPEQRMEICKRFTNVKKTCYVHWSEDAPLVPLEYEKTSLPTEEEGFDKVVFEIKKEDVEEKLNVWKKQCKLHSCCDELKPGAFLKEKMAEYEALKKAYRNKGKEELKAEEETKAEEATQAEEKPKAEETPKTEESPKAEETPKAEDVNMDEKKEDAPAASEGNKGEDATETEDAIKKTVTEEQKLEAPTRIETPTDVSEWTDEDWMLADLRAELHLLCHAFREDVEDKERTAFPLTYLHHYYRVYFPTKTIRADTYACENFKDLVSTLMDDTVEVKDALLLPLLSKDEALEKIIEMTEDVRNMRTERVGAGDETAALKFKAVAVKQYSQQHHQQHSHQRGAYQNRAYQPYLQQNKGKGGYGFQKGSPAHHGGDRFQGDRFQGDRFQSNPSSQYQNRQQYQTQQPAGNFRSNYGSGGGYQQRSGYQQRAYDNNRGGQHQRQQYQHGGDQGHRPQSQQWGGVKRDQPSDGFHQQQPPNQRYPPRF